ncbi:nuclear factor of activated T-cells, cytoplasmic 2-like isoform X2 [Dunckerocampus dactyliophorus]|uniref:nuclear factor of activated T-cells, cytoplasmic 2-like isoform X2 n=1 Tax=Dunckerocampus dactyliophorus TaxID=161453 RepID=UPI002405E1BC|nr:nuclear factor of activated T-cells, cytoplasmic 2-like isoform X2 [Dunckerocampus dactyliophorus]
MTSDISQEELDFADLFLYNPPVDDFSGGFIQDNGEQHPLLVVNTAFVQDALSHSPANESSSSEVAFDYMGLATTPGIIPAPSPRIEITPSGDSLNSQALEQSPGSKAPGTYRECASPASSNSSTGWPAEGCSPSASPSISPSNRGKCATELSTLDLCHYIEGIHTSSTYSSPGGSPGNSFTDEPFLLPQHQGTPSPLVQRRSRSVSPQGKRTHNQVFSGHETTPVKQRSRSSSPIPLAYDLLGHLHHRQVQDEFQTQTQTTTTGLEDRSLNSCQEVGGSAHEPNVRQDCVYREVYDRLGAEAGTGSFCVVPTSWPPHPVHLGAFGLSLVPLPSLEWPLPSKSGQYELLIQPQPRSHHRAHYETEGSRGTVKTPNGGHPEVQLRGYQGTAPLVLQVFIGTADERLLKPHAFYQVHRITGKTVTTPNMERMVKGTKVLEIPLQPKNNMRAVIDCVGILKLRNADIELRNGETDMGRKNTRVRLVFRVHIPQSGGQLVSLQVASLPIECSQHSAQEIPLVKKQNLDRCSVRGRQYMLLTGQNFTCDSRVMFSEKTQDGLQIWEVEATVDREKSQANMLLVEVPPYRDQTICHAAKVNFYVTNGKKKRSEPQHFIYTPVIAIKAEPLDGWQLNLCAYSDIQTQSGTSAKSLICWSEQQSNLEAFSVSPTRFHLTKDTEQQDFQPVFYQSRAGNIIHNTELLYRPTNQLYYNNSAAVLHGGLLTPSNPANIHALVVPLPQGVTIKNPSGKLSQGSEINHTFQAYSSTRHHSTVQAVQSLEKSPPLRWVQGDIHAKAQTQDSNPDSVAANRDARTQERLTVKQEDLSCVYLEDVNDIIRRDLRDNHGDAGGLQRHAL